MGARFVVTPWRDPEELLQVRQDLYSAEGANSIERRQKAVRTASTPRFPELLTATLHACYGKWWNEFRSSLMLDRS